MEPEWSWNKQNEYPGRSRRVGTVGTNLEQDAVIVLMRACEQTSKGELDRGDDNDDEEQGDSRERGVRSN